MQLIGPRSALRASRHIESSPNAVDCVHNGCANARALVDGNTPRHGLFLACRARAAVMERVVHVLTMAWGVRVQ